MDEVTEDPLVLGLPPFDRATNCLNKLHDKGVDIVYITFRTNASSELTYEWLEMHGFPNPRNVYFAESFLFKTDILKKLGAIGIVDDDESVCLHAVNNGFYAFKHVFNDDDVAFHLKNSKLVPWWNWPELYYKIESMFLSKREKHLT